MDGLVTDIPGVSLVVFGADCLPVLFYDPVRRVVAAAHAGWRGTAAGIVERAVEKMAFYGSRPEDILAAIGPGISRCCFETHEDVPNAMTSALGVCATPVSYTHLVHTDHVGAEPLHGQVLGRRARVAAKKIRIGDAVPGGVGLGVGDGGGNDLRTDDLARAPGHDQRDGADTAVEVQYLSLIHI